MACHCSFCFFAFIFTGNNNTDQSGITAFNLSSKSWEIDVHRLKVREATRRVEKMLRDMLLQNASTLRVIVGKGNHSAGNVPVLKTAILDHMARCVVQFI